MNQAAAEFQQRTGHPHGGRRRREPAEIVQQAIITPVPRGRSAALRARRCRPRTPDPTCWRDETTVRVKGRWCYLSRAINAAPANGITVTLTTGGTATLDTDYTLSSTTITLAEGPEADLGYGMLCWSGTVWSG